LLGGIFPEVDPMAQPIIIVLAHLERPFSQHNGTSDGQPGPMISDDRPVVVGVMWHRNFSRPSRSARPSLGRLAADIGRTPRRCGMSWGRLWKSTMRRRHVRPPGLRAGGGCCAFPEAHPPVGTGGAISRQTNHFASWCVRFGALITKELLATSPAPACSGAGPAPASGRSACSQDPSRSPLSIHRLMRYSGSTNR
jgi:hypothetical protein